MVLSVSELDEEIYGPRGRNAEVVRLPKRQHIVLDQSDRKPPANPFPLVWFADIEPCLDVADFVQGLLIEGTAAVVYGDSNAGKTFWVTDLSLHVAAGHEWAGRRVEQGGVIYCVLEGGMGFRNRVYGWKKKRALDDAVIPFAAIPSQINLLDSEADIDRLIYAIEQAAGQIDVPVKLVVIDTLSRALAGGNENAPEDMGALVMNMDTIRAATGACVVFVHHSGKDQAKGARGHSLLRAAIDTEIEVVADDDTGVRTATVVKQREMKKGDVFTFTLESIELGDNRHGELTTTCAVLHSESCHPDVAMGPSPHTRTGGSSTGRLRGHEKRAFDVLLDVLSQHGKTGFVGVPTNVPSVPEKWWRETFLERCPGETLQAKNKAFRRAILNLVNTKMVGVNADRVWVSAHVTMLAPIKQEDEPE